mgnify:FL=1
MLRKPKPKGDTEQAKPRKAAGVTRSTSTTETEERSQTKQQLNLSVPGEPIGQPRHRVCTIGGQARMYLPKSHPVHAFKAAIRAAFIQEAKRWRTIQGPVLVNINVWFGIPASWSRKKRTSYCGLYHAQKPDADNVVKAVLDALTDCEVWVDDSQVAICQVTKRWAGSEPQTLIEIVEL